MSQRLRKYAPLLRHLHASRGGAKLKALLRQKVNKDKNFVSCICECACNIIKGNVHLTGEQKTKLAKRKKALRQLVAKSTPLKVKKRIIQSGGFLGALLAPIASILGGLFSGGG